MILSHKGILPLKTFSVWTLQKKNVDIIKTAEMVWIVHVLFKTDTLQSVFKV